MKNIFKYSAMMLLSVLAFTLGACTEEYEYTKVKANGEQVYFRNDISVASMAKDRDTVQVPVNRIQSKGELQVQLQVTQESNSKLSIPSTVTFADGETQAYLVISYDPAAIDYGFSEDVTVAIADESLTTQYGNSSCTFTVELSEWETIGQGLYKDGVFSIYGLDDVTSQVTIQENMFTKGLYRILSPYGEGTNFYNTYIEAGYFRWAGGDNTNVIIDATDPDYVYISEDFYPGTDDGYGDQGQGLIHVFSSVLTYIEQGIPLDYIKSMAPEEFGTLTDGVITLPNTTVYMNFGTDLTSEGYVGSSIQVALPGYQFVDYSSSFEYTGRFTDTEGNDYAQGTITLGRDVESAKYIVASEGDDTDAIISAIEDGSLSGTTITESGAVSFTLTESGDYNMIIVTYGEDGKVHGSSVNPFTFTLSGDASAKPEWVAIATGTFTHNVQPDFILSDPSDQTSYVGNPFIGVQGFTPTYQTVIYQDANNPSSYKVEPYIFQGNSLPFTMYSDGSISFSDVETGFTYGNYGNVLAGDYNLVSGQSAQYGYSSYYDAENNTYWFGTAFYILISGENAWLGGAYETFTVTSTTGVAPRKGMKANIKALLPKTAKAGTKHFKTFSGTKMQTAAVKGGLKRSVNK